MGEVRFYEGVEFLGAVDLDVRDVGMRVGEVEVFVGWGWGLVFCHCEWECGLNVGLCAEGRNSCWCKASHVKCQGKMGFGDDLLFLCFERPEKSRLTFIWTSALARCGKLRYCP